MINVVKDVLSILSTLLAIVVSAIKLKEHAARDDNKKCDGSV